MTSEKDEGVIFEEVAEKVVALANDYGERGEDVDPWEVAAGLLAGTVQFWLFSHQPCEEKNCKDCEAISTGKLRLKMILDEVKELAESSDYFHSPNDTDVGRA